MLKTVSSDCGLNLFAPSRTWGTRGRGEASTFSQIPFSSFPVNYQTPRNRTTIALSRIVRSEISGASTRGFG